MLYTQKLILEDTILEILMFCKLFKYLKGSGDFKMIKKLILHRKYFSTSSNNLKIHLTQCF